MFQLLSMILASIFAGVAYYVAVTGGSPLFGAVTLGAAVANVLAFLNPLLPKE